MGQSGSHSKPKPKLEAKNSEIQSPLNPVNEITVANVCNSDEPPKVTQKQISMRKDHNATSNRCDSISSEETDENENISAQIEVCGIQPDPSSIFTKNMTPEDLYKMITDTNRCDPLQPLELHRIFADTEEETGAMDICRQNAEKNGQFQLTSIKRPAIVLVSDIGIGLARPLWQQMAKFEQLGRIIVVYNAPNPMTIHYGKELAHLLVEGIISDLIFVYGDPDSSLQIKGNPKVTKLIRKKAADGAHVYVAGTPPFNMAMRHMIAKLTLISSDILLQQDWFHAILVDRYDRSNLK